MKKLICAVFLSGLLATGLPAPPSATSGAYTPPPTLAEVLHAHNLPPVPGALANFTAEAVKLTAYDNGHDAPSTFFERRVSVSADGEAFRRYRADPLGLRERGEVFDGLRAYRIVRESGRQAGELEELSDSQTEAVGFSIRTFGLVPVLKQLADSPTKATFVGRTAKGRDRFSVETAAGNISLSCDPQHLVRTVEIGRAVIEYADYRSVDGVRLPFIQRLTVDGRLLYELFFTRIDLAVKFPAGHFTREAL